MPYRYVITKASAQGEQITASVEQCHPITGDVMHSTIEMTQMVQHALSITETRMTEMNVRMLEAYELSRYFDPSTWQRVIAILDILAGRQSADAVSRRWHSEVEETQALEQARIDALGNSPNQEYLDTVQNGV